jgi:hypothetical protein
MEVGRVTLFISDYNEVVVVVFSVGHLLPWISPKYVALKNVVYSL